MAEFTPDCKNSRKMNATRNLTSFWIFGLCNNFAYVVMLSAAQDILQKSTPTSTRFDEHRNATRHCLEEITDRECLSLSTGAVLLCNIIPALLVKLTFPFFIHRIPYGIRHSIVVITQAISLLVTAFSDSVAAALLGVCIASFSCGLGEITYLALASHYSKHSISTWSSGTGAAGIAGAFSYAGMTDKHLLGLTPKCTLLIMLCVPAIFSIVYAFVLVQPPTIRPISINPNTWIEPARAAPEKPVPSKNIPLHLAGIDTPITGLDHPHGKDKRNSIAIISPVEARHTTVVEKLGIIKSLLRYMIPLGLVYFGEYFINQGLVELISFDCSHGFGTSPGGQYRWYQVIYQVGVFLSRSSINVVEFSMPLIAAMPVLQLLNVAIFYFDAIFQYIPHMWMLIALIFFEGIIGGASYVNTFNHIHKAVPAEDREFSLTTVSLADAVGILTAALSAIPVHNYICGLPRF